MDDDETLARPDVKPRSKPLRLGRELALRVLYAVDLNAMSAEEAWARCCNSFLCEEYPALTDPYDAEMSLVQDVAIYWLHQIRERGPELDEAISGASKRWKLGRMPAVDRNILRVGTFELLEGEVPPRDVIYDCVELAKTYGDGPTHKFVNGILDQICHNQGITL